jgi:uncharacterized repeat protein (TIGR01451 family)
VRFDEQVRNAGPGDAHNVTVVDVLPNGLAFLSSTSSVGSCSSGPAVTCQLGTLTAGSSATVTIRARATQTGTFVNRATVTSPDPDTNLGNNAAQATVKVNGPFIPPTSTTPSKNEPPKTTTTTGNPNYTG